MSIKVDCNPSSDWYQSEVDSVIIELCVRMQERIKMGTLQPNDAMDTLERIQMLAEKTPAFLEANRAAILNGQ